MKNIIDLFLQEISVPHTRRFTEKLYAEHPNKYNMLGIKQILKVYGVDMVGVKFINKENADIVLPCILHLHGGFAIATDITKNILEFIWEGKKTKQNVKDFCRIWSGHALLLKNINKEKHSEPNYSLHRTEEIIANISGISKFAIPIVLISLLFIHSRAYLNLSAVREKMVVLSTDKRRTPVFDW